jgi:hypothetical protein
LSRLASWPRLLGLGLVLLVLAGVAAVWLAYQHNQSLPVYDDGELAPVDGIAVNTLSRGDSLYIGGPFEFSLEVVEEPFDFTWGRQIGKTSRDLAIFKPKGHDGSQYIFTRGDMTGDSVYRNSRSAAPTSLDDLNVTALELVYNERGSLTTRRTQDGALIRDAKAALTSAAGVRPDPATPRRIQHLRLLSDQLPGLAYFAYAIADDRGAVYLARRAREDELWIPVSDSLSRWLAFAP